MTVTLFSVITSMLLCNVYIIFIAFMRQHNSFLIRFSLVPLALLIATGVFRLICFVEIPGAAVIGSDNIFPAVLKIVNMRLFTIFNNNIAIHIYDILIAAWILGSIYNLLKYVHQSNKLYKSVNAVPPTDDMRIISCMDEVLAENRKNTKVKIIKSAEINIPMIAGLLKPVICLPDIQFSDDELKNILLHEWTHFLQKHAWVKLSMYLICSVFWWNPFVHILRRELNHILEIQCDLSITSKMDEEARINYLDIILKIIRISGKSALTHTLPMNCAALVSTNKAKKIEQRFNLVLDYDSGKKQHMFPVFLLCTFILLFSLASYKVVIQPMYYPTTEAGYEETFSITPENSYLTINEDGTYSLYTDDKYRCDIEKIDVEPFSSLPIK
jgi:beta-lactamase regulating signal transducer with metallopeptidase domain